MGPEVTRITGSCVAILPEIKWTLTLSGVLAFLGGISNVIYREWVKNREIFYNEYNEILTQLGHVADVIEYWGSANLDSPYDIEQINTVPIEHLMKHNPKKIEYDLTEDWEKTNNLIDQLRKEKDRDDEDFSEDRFYTKQKNALEKVKWLENKVENYYTCHFHRRLWYRIKR